MNDRLNDLRTHTEQEKGKQAQLRSDCSQLRSEIKKLKVLFINNEKACEILKLVGLKTQQQLQFHISDIATLALEAVFPKAYTLQVSFVERRNKTECDLFFERDGSQMDPLDSTGGGAVDIAAFALRIASWSMKNPKTHNTIILDEPMRNLSVEYQEQASKMIKEVSEKLGIQFIIITHELVLAAWADREFKNTIKNKVSKISLK